MPKYSDFSANITVAVNTILTTITYALTWFKSNPWYFAGFMIVLAVATRGAEVDIKKGKAKIER